MYVRRIEYLEEKRREEKREIISGGGKNLLVAPYHGPDVVDLSVLARRRRAAGEGAGARRAWVGACSRRSLGLRWAKKFVSRSARARRAVPNIERRARWAAKKKMALGEEEKEYRRVHAAAPACSPRARVGAGVVRRSSCRPDGAWA